MSHDTDKLIRQLSLVAFLMAERRPLTARDVKSNVEGYSEMSDEAFARRFYSDRAELLALGVPLHSPAFLFERVTRSERGEIVEFVHSIYRGDRYRLVTDLTAVPLPHRPALAGIVRNDGSGQDQHDD